MFLEEGGEILSKLNQRILLLEAAPGDREALQSALRLVHTLKGGARMVGLDQVSTAAHEFEDLLKNRTEGGTRLDASDVTRLLGMLDAMRAVLDLVAQGRSAEASPPDLSAPSAPAPGTGGAGPESGSSPVARAGGGDRLRVSVERLDVLQNLMDDLTLRKARIASHADQVRRAARGLQRVAWAGDEAEFTPRERAALRRLVPVLSGRGFGDFLEDLHHLDRTMEELQGQVLDLRMVPLAEVLEEFQRTVRDLGQELGKQIAFTIDGKFTEVDKNLLEAVRGPLLHLVRNAVDHGIEPPDERKAAGKSALGHVTIRAYHKGTAAVIEIEDDGRGLDPRAIRDKALRGGFLSEAEGGTLSDDELLYLLCEPGFTTRERVTEISGRGVGLDVVRSELEKLKGSLSIRSEKGAGSRFRLYLPISISRVPVLLVRVGSMHCGLPSLFVEGCFRVRASDLAARDGTWVHGDHVLPVVSLARVLGERRATGARTTPLVVLQFRGRTMALQVDELLEEREVVLKGLGEHLGGVPYVLGVSLLADEQPVPILNVVDLYPQWHRLETTCRFHAEAEPRTSRVLVVDDSMTTRHMERTILEGLGYEVLQASDGAEAWERLRREVVDLVVSDVEMPAMDGLELARRIRATEALAHLPLVMVSNRVATEDQRAAFSAGADAYLRKDRFSQRELGATLRGLLTRGRDDGGAERDRTKGGEGESRGEP